MKLNKETLGLCLLFGITGIVGIVMGDASGLSAEGATLAWVGAAINAATKVAGGLTSAIGGAVSAAVANKYAKKANEEMTRGQQYLDDWNNAVMATDILDRADTRSMLAAYRDTMAEQNRKYTDNAIKGGATEEGRVAYNTSANKGYADAISKISAQGQAIKDNVSQAYMQGKLNYHNSVADNYMQTGKAMGEALSKGFSSMGNAISGAAGKSGNDGIGGAIMGLVKK